MAPARPALAALTAFTVLLALVGCHGSPGPPTDSAASSPFQGCPTGPTTGPAATPSPTGTAAGAGLGKPGPRLPSVLLPCFTGGQLIDLAALGRPVVINVWSSSCAPCRKELPEVQRFAAAAQGQVVVLGVVTGDTRAAAASTAVDLAVSFPAVFDPEMTFLRAMGRAAIPVTFFVDATGQVRHTDVSGALTQAALIDLARAQLGVRVG